MWGFIFKWRGAPWKALILMGVVRKKLLDGGFPMPPSHYGKPWSLSMVFDSISSNIDEIFSINLFSNVFAFGDFNVHHKDWLTYSGGTGWPGELYYNFSISNDLTQMVNFPTQIPDCDSHSPALLDLFLSSDTSLCSTMAFPPLGNSNHVVVLVSIDFPSNSPWDAPFHHIVSKLFWCWLRWSS